MQGNWVKRSHLSYGMLFQQLTGKNGLFLGSHSRACSKTGSFGASQAPAEDSRGVKTDPPCAVESTDTYLPAARQPQNRSSGRKGRPSAGKDWGRVPGRTSVV